MIRLERLPAGHLPALTPDARTQNALLLRKGAYRQGCDSQVNNSIRSTHQFPYVYMQYVQLVIAYLFEKENIALHE
jgi:hypothetical protein